MNRKNIKNLYAIGHASWYDPFKKIWDRLASTKAESKLITFLEKNLNEEVNILELACGTALNLDKIFAFDLKFKKYLGFDFSPDMLEIAKAKFINIPNVEFRQKDVTDLNDIDEKFDIIICTWLLSHLQSPSQVVNKAQELLASQGKIFIIFFSKPKWFVNFWLQPLAKLFFKAKPLTDKEIGLFKNIQVKHRFSANITTCVLIHK